MVTVEEAEQQIQQRRQELAEAQRQQQQAEEQISKAEAQTMSQKFRRQMSGIQGLRERQKIQANLSQARQDLLSRSQAIQQADSQLSEVQNQINEARGGQAEQSEAYQKAIAAYEKGDARIAYFGGKKATKIYRDLMENKQNAINSTLQNLESQGLDDAGLRDVERMLKEDIGKTGSKQITSRINDYLNAKYNTQKVDLPQVEQIQTLDATSVNVPNAQVIEINPKTGRPYGELQKAKTGWAGYKEYISDKPYIQGSVSYAFGKVFGSLARAESRDLNSQPLFKEGTDQIFSTAAQTALYFTPPGIVIGALEGAEAIGTKRGRAAITRTADQLQEDYDINPAITKPVLYGLSGLAVAGGAYAGARKAISKFPATYETTFLSREVNSNIPGVLESNQATRTVRKTILSNDNYYGTSKTFTKVQKPIVEGGISKFEAVTIGNQQQRGIIAPVSNLRAKPEILTYSSKEKGMFQTSMVGDTPVTTTVSVTTPGKSAVKNYVPINEQGIKLQNLANDKITQVKQAAGDVKYNILTPYYGVRNKVSKNLNKVSESLKANYDEGAYWAKAMAYKNIVNPAKRTGQAALLKSEAYLVNPVKEGGKLFWDVQKETASILGRTVAAQRPVQATIRAAQRVGQVAKRTGQAVSTPFVKLNKFAKQINRPQWVKNVQNKFAKKKPLNERQYLSVGFLVPQKADDSISLAFSRSSPIQKFKKGDRKFWELSNKDNIESLGRVESKKVEEIAEEGTGYSILTPNDLAQARKKTWQEMDLLSQESAKKAAQIAAEEASIWRAAQTINRAKVTVKTASAANVAPMSSPSIYAGLGKYEKTDFYSNPITGQATKGDVEASISPPTNELSMTSKDNIVFKTKDDQIKGQNDFISQRQNEDNILKIRTKLKLERPTDKIISNQIQNPIPRQNNIPRALFKFRQLQKQRTRQLNVVKSEIPKAPTPRNPRLRGVLWGFGGGRSSSKIAEPVEDEFSLFVRRRGKDILIKKVKNILSAVKEGKKIVDKTLAASFSIKRGGSPVNLSKFSIQNYRPSKRDVFRLVQERKKRLSSSSERKEIQFFKNKKSKKRGGLWGF